MAILLNQHPAPGGPGIEPRWTRSDKAGVGTAYSSLSDVWFTISKGIVNEVYFPTIDRPQIRDLQYLISDGKTFFHAERQLQNSHEYLAPHALGFRITNTDPQGRYRIIKEVISAPHRAGVLIHTRLEVTDRALAPHLRLFVLMAPHLEVGGWGNNGNVLQTNYGKFLVAYKGDTWAGLAVPGGFARCSCGYAGVSDGWQDLEQNFQMDWEYDSAPDGNIALTGEIDLTHRQEFTLCLAFGKSLHQMMSRLAQAHAIPFQVHRDRFLEQWQRAAGHLRPGPEHVTGDGGHLYRMSHALILAHEDKRFEGGLIASLSIPWGEAKSDNDLGGYHLVWTRDMVNSATALLAAGDSETPLRALIYLASTQREDGGFYQNFWIDGQPYWRGIQLDEVAFPIMLAWRLRAAKALQSWDPWPMVQRAAGYLIQHGPATPEERWEENSGYSPSTLASNIAALICAAALAREQGQEGTARFLEEYADFLESHVEAWTVTTQGTLVPGIARHFIRIHPVDVNDPQPDEDANHGILQIKNLPPDVVSAFPAKDIVDAGFLELVRYGIRKAGDPLFEDSLRAVDAVLKVETPFGPCWRRYNHDGYGQRADGGPWLGTGKGRGWPLLTGERGHYELAAGRDVRPFIRALESFATSTALLPEQVWDEPDKPEAHMYLGRPTGSAMPLMWAHAEYLRLVRSANDGQVFDLIPEVAHRYGNGKGLQSIEVWKLNRQVCSVPAGTLLRIVAAEPFQLHWTSDDWQHAQDLPSTSTVVSHEFVDIQVSKGQQAPIRFTFYWTDKNSWEGRDYQVAVR